MNYDTETWPVLFECMSGSGWISRDGQKKKKKKKLSQGKTLKFKQCCENTEAKITSLKIHRHTQRNPEPELSLLPDNDFTSEWTLGLQLNSGNLQARWVSDTLAGPKSHTSIKPWI